MDSYFAFSNILMWTEGIWGLLTFIFWSLTYIFIIIAGFFSKKERKVSMPYISATLNIAWEIAATIHTGGNPGFIIWFIIDILIFCFGFVYLSSGLKRILFCALTFLSIGLLAFSFKMHSASFLFSVYLIDVIMAIEYLVKRKSLSKKFMITIAITKLLGDFFAGLTFGNMYTFIWFFASISFMCNCVYLILRIGDRIETKT